MKIPIITVALGLVLLGVTWAPNLYKAALDHSFPPSSPVTPTVISNGTVPAQYGVKYGAFFRDLAVMVREDTDIKTTDQLLSGAQKAIKLFKTTDNLPDLPALNQQVSDKLTPIAKDPKALDTDTRNKFATACDELAASLGVK